MELRLRIFMNFELGDFSFYNFSLKYLYLFVPIPYFSTVCVFVRNVHRFPILVASASQVQIDHIKSTPDNCARAISQGLIGRASKNSCVASILNAICDGTGTAAAIRKADAEKDNDG